MTIRDVDSNEFLKRANQNSPQNITSGEAFFLLLLSPLSWLLIAAILFGVAYLISRGWHVR